MNKISITLSLIFVSVILIARDETITVVGGSVEVFDSGTSCWVKKIRGSQISGNVFIRSARPFALRERNGLSETYSPCDCTLVSALSPQKKNEMMRYDNNVISRESFDAGFILSPAFLKVYNGEKWEFCIISSSDEGQELNYEVTSSPDWMIIDNPAGVLTDKIVVTGKIDAEKTAASRSSDSKCTIVCNGKSLDLPVLLAL